MAVRRVVANIACADPGALAGFYADLFGLELAMDLGWIATLTGGGTAPLHLSLASEGGSGTPVPGISIEVDDLDAVHRRALSRGLTVDYGPVEEPWGVRRFYLRDPAGTLVNVLAHAE